MAKKLDIKTRKDGRMEKVVDGHHFYGRTEKELLRKIKNFQDKKETGVLFDVIADAWYTETEDRVTAKTWEGGYVSAYNKAVDYFRGIPFKDITTQDCAAYVNTFVAKGLSYKTVCNNLNVLQMIFQKACIDYNCYNNPAALVKVPRSLPRKKRVSPNQSQIDIIKESTDVPFGDFFFFLLYTGMRRGEALAIEWSDIDWENKIINVNKSVTYTQLGAFVKSPKTKAGERDVPLLDKLSENLKLRKKKSGRIFAEPDGSIITESHLLMKIKRYSRATGANATFHQLRHAFATICFEAGLEPKDVQHILGHANISTTMDIYTDWRSGRLDNAAAKLNQFDF